MRKLPLFPTLGKVLKKSFVELYQSFGVTLLLSLIWVPGYFLLLMAASPLLLGMKQNAVPNGLPSYGVMALLGITVVNALWAGPITTALYGFYQERKTGYPNLKTFLSLFKQHYLRSAGVHAIYWVAITLLGFNLISAIVHSNFFFKISGMFSAYCLFFLSLMPFFFHPLLFMKNSIFKTIKKSALLLLDNFGVCFWLNLVLGILLVGSLAFPPLMVFLMFAYGAFLIYVVDSGFEAIWAKYGEEPGEEEKQ
jgi:uncharacterized membrane protein YesL